jgi:hypothetical protein
MDAYTVGEVPDPTNWDALSWGHMPPVLGQPDTIDVLAEDIYVNNIEPQYCGRL